VSRRRHFGWLLAAAVACGLAVTGSAASGNWVSAGGDLQNTRSASQDNKITVGNVGGLQVKWQTNLGLLADVSATPAVEANRIYVPDWAGKLSAVDRATGAIVWQASIAGASGVPFDRARATPVVAGNKVIVGTQGPFGGGGKLLAFDKNTGLPLWSTVLDSHPAAIITQSAQVFNGIVYVGVASQDEAFSAFIPNYPCCTFRGSMMAVDVDTGAVLWKTYLAPQGFSGSAIWGSSPSIDPKRGQLYVATGNNYSVPPEVLDCVKAAGSDPGAQQACIPADDHFDSILALDLKTGAIRWATRALPYDGWTVACIFVADPSNVDNCPDPAGPDYDFGQAPNLYTVRAAGNGKPTDIVGAGQKSGQYWALNPDTGEVLWTTQTGPGGTAGGLQWGSAADGKRVYTADSNSNEKVWTLPNGSTTTHGLWSGLDAVTGQILWQTADPLHGASDHVGGSSSGPPTTTNGVVFACSLDAQGHMYALNGATGAILWSFASGGGCLSGAAISNGEVYWGSGYANFGFSTGNPTAQLFAFKLP